MLFISFKIHLTVNISYKNIYIKIYKYIYHVSTNILFNKLLSKGKITLFFYLDENKICICYKYNQRLGLRIWGLFRSVLAVSEEADWNSLEIIRCDLKRGLGTRLGADRFLNWVCSAVYWPKMCLLLIWNGWLIEQW